ncbi:hypothetical protein [Micromonospora sediminimaris]|uniref:Uncharacterized protein n=1 Tax=Micromonospora sediminimaris TaxID=547162 RepID=A0A9W5UQF0_9ACTN|nr:hypothetical protein [Micromonospora sediminimaris]GIJ33712.1 hypothetical protein Vse01_28600 [Micromonospora sediminimaris]SFD46688.1 hypothetical protein SAMN05216284_11780 [Micromonospora sediminimaris]
MSGHAAAAGGRAIELGQRPFDRLFLKRADEVLNSDGLLLGLLRIAELHGQPHFLRQWLDAERVAQQLRCYHPTRGGRESAASLSPRDSLSC